MKILLIALAVVAVFLGKAIAYKMTDWTCVQDCLNKGYMYSYCIDDCSYDPYPY